MGSQRAWGAARVLISASWSLDPSREAEHGPGRGWAGVGEEVELNRDTGWIPGKKLLIPLRLALVCPSDLHQRMFQKLLRGP